MTKEQQIQEHINKLKESEVQTFVAKVIKVYKETKTITVQDIHGITYTDVRLSAVIADGDKVVAYPKPTSWLLVSLIENMGYRLFVSAFSEVEAIEGAIENTAFHIDKAGYQINRNGKNLKAVLNAYIDEFGKLCDELAKVVVSIGVTPNVPVIHEIKQRATETIKQDLNTILK